MIYVCLIWTFQKKRIVKTTPTLVVAFEHISFLFHFHWTRFILSFLFLFFIRFLDSLIIPQLIDIFNYY